MFDCEGAIKMSEGKTAKVKLDWSRLLGFDQADVSADALTAGKMRDPRLTKLGTKPGVKVGAKFGTKIGVKLAD